MARSALTALGNVGGRIRVEGTPREVLAAPSHDRLRTFLRRIELRQH
jgi:ABC-type histidine transport system ATPase subunit